MTEADVKKIEEQVLVTAVDPSEERVWAEGTRAALRKTEQQVMAEFKMWRFVRDDARMQQAAKELERLRACLAYLDSVLA